MSISSSPRTAPELRITAGSLADLGPLDVHALYKLRVDVFVAEQRCPYVEIDDVDAHPDTTHLLVRGPGQEPTELAATLRVYGDDRVMHLGRVCTAAQWRGRGIAARLIRMGLERCGGRPVEIGAQAHLQQWYEQFGFEVSGPEYMDERIPHIPMRRHLLR